MATTTHPPNASLTSALTQDSDALPPHTRMGELEILRVLGMGGFGIVYLARDHALQRDVALKEYMPASLAKRGRGSLITVRSASFADTYAAGLRSFINEARLLARFDHPSLVKVYRFWEDNGTAYMLMPCLPGRTLRDTRRAMARTPHERWLRSLVDPLLGALDVMHREGVYHRDIAPDNIILADGGVPVLLDFGAARHVISDRTQSLTAILKPSYAPIEQYAEMTQFRQGPWTDLYALGAVLHFVLEGTPPSPSTARAVQDDSVPLAQRSFPGVSRRFLAAIDWTLAMRPQERPQNVEALRAALDGRLEPPVPSGRRGLAAARARAATESLPHPAPNQAFATTQRLAPPGGVRGEVPVLKPPVTAAPVSPRRWLSLAALLPVLAGIVWLGSTWNGGLASNRKDAALRSPPVAEGRVTDAVPVSAPLVTTNTQPTAVVAATAPTPVTVPASGSMPIASPATEPAVATTPRPEATQSSAGASAAGGSSLQASAELTVPTRGPPAAEAAPTAAAVTETTIAAVQRPSAVAAQERRPVSRVAATNAPAAAPRLATTAREACSEHLLFAIVACLERECRRPRFSQDPECVEINAAQREQRVE
jgi:hypothetical protein